MKAIMTVYRGPTASGRGSRIVAYDNDGNRVSVTYPSEKRMGEEAHFEGARALCSKMNWKGTLHAGSIGSDCYVFVWSDGEGRKV